MAQSDQDTASRVRRAEESTESTAWHSATWDSRDLKFQRLAAQIRRGIFDGTWAPGAKLPTVGALEAETGLSLTTIRRAYDELERVGLVVRKQGAGTFVATAPERSHARLSIGVLVPDTKLYFPGILQGIEEVLTAAGAHLVLADSRYDRGVEAEALQRLIEARVDGLLFVPLLDEAEDPETRVAQIEALPVKTVLIERRIADAGPADSSFHVCTDHEGGAYDAVRHLHDLGHRKLALILRGSYGPAASPIQHGFERAAAAFGLETIIDRSDEIIWDADLADEAIGRLRGKATAAVCYGDREGVLLLGAARRAGLRVPEDLAIVTYDNEMADVAEVPLTALAPPKYLLGKLAADLILRRLASENDLPPHQVMLRPTLIVRLSCGATTRGAARERRSLAPKPKGKRHGSPQRASA